MHAYSANRNHSWLRRGGQAPQLFSSCTREKQEGTTFIASLLPPNGSQLKQHWLINRARRNLFLGYKQQQNLGLMANKHPQFKPGEAMGLKGWVESQTPCHSSSHTHKGQKQATLPLPPFEVPHADTLAEMRLQCLEQLKTDTGPREGGRKRYGVTLPHHHF